MYKYSLCVIRSGLKYSHIANGSNEVWSRDITWLPGTIKGIYFNMIGGVLMKYDANSTDEYIEKLSSDRKTAVMRLRKTIKDNLPVGFQETMSYGMIGYVVPKSIYPSGYHANPSEPLPFMSIASQKNHIALYHMGVYMFPDILTWFQDEYAKQVGTKLDMGKGCIRFKRMDSIPYDLIEELCRKITVEDFLNKYVLEVKR